MLIDIIWRNKVGLSLAFCLIFSLTCMLWQGNAFTLGVSYIGLASDRISGAMNSSMRLTGELWVEIDRFRELEKKYQVAQKLIEEYRLEKDKFDQLRKENKKLRSMLELTPVSDYPEVKAEVLGIRLNSISPRMVISKGRKDGIELFMPVITSASDLNSNQIRAVVGIVVDVSDDASVIRPLTHSSFRMGVRLPDSDQWAIYSGNSGSLMAGLLTYVSSKVTSESVTITHFESNVEINSEVLTSGEAGIFPPGIPVGVVIREGVREGEFRTAFVKPFAAIPSLDHVSVILKKPAEWSEQMSNSASREDYFITPFDLDEDEEQIIKDLTSKKSRPPIRKEENKPEESSLAETGGDVVEVPTEPEKSQPEKKAEVKPPKKPVENRPQRRLQNLSAPE